MRFPRWVCLAGVDVDHSPGRLGPQAMAAIPLPDAQTEWVSTKAVENGNTYEAIFADFKAPTPPRTLATRTSTEWLAFFPERAKGRRPVAPESMVAGCNSSGRKAAPR